MTTTDWSPGQWKRQRKLQSPLTGVPEHLVHPLIEWIDGELHTPATRVQLAVDLQWTALPDYWATYPGRCAAEEMQRRLKRSIGPASDAVILNVVEWCLEHGDQVDQLDDPEDEWGLRKIRGAHLEELLSRGNSAYRVRTDGKGLEFRISAEAIRQFEATVTDADSSAADHLVGAWNAAYAINPDPVKSVSEAVKAIEASYEKLISPKNDVQTLGSMIRDIRAAPQKWSFVLNDHADADGVAMVVAMMNQVWKNQQRHATGPNARPETIEEARCSVHIAGTLVHFATSSAFAKLP